jgi:acetyl esterase
VIGAAGYDRPLRDLARATGCLIVAPNVRLAPEYPFPAAVEDALTVMNGIAAASVDLAGGVGPVGIAGDSSGGNLAAVATRELSREGRAPCFQVLLYPMLDATASSPSYLDFATGYGFTRDKSLWYFSQYLPAGIDRGNPRVSPPARRPSTASVRLAVPSLPDHSGRCSTCSASDHCRAQESRDCSAGTSAAPRSVSW